MSTANTEKSSLWSIRGIRILNHLQDFFTCQKIIYTAVHYTLWCFGYPGHNPALFSAVRFIIGAVCCCFFKWCVLALERHLLGKTLDLLADLQQQRTENDRRRANFHPITVMISITNFIQARVWAVMLVDDLALDFVFCVSDITQVAIILLINMLYRFSEEVHILRADFNKAVVNSDSAGLRTCYLRHQKLTQVITAFEDKVKLYLQLHIYFFTITIGCLLLAMQLNLAEDCHFVILLLTVQLVGLLMCNYCAGNWIPKLSDGMNSSLFEWTGIMLPRNVRPMAH